MVTRAFLRCNGLLTTDYGQKCRPYLSHGVHFHVFNLDFGGPFRIQNSIVTRILAIEDEEFILGFGQLRGLLIGCPENVQKKFKNSLTQGLAFWDIGATHGNK